MEKYIYDKNNGLWYELQGGYSKDEKQIIFFIVNRFQINKMKKIVKDIDNMAFISLQNIADIVRRPTD